MISEYLLIKDKKHNRFCFVQGFYNFYHIKRQNFIKYYNRYKLSKLNNCSLKEINESLLPNKRGPRYIHNRTKVSEEIINKIKELRINNGMNKYNIKKELEIEFDKNVNNLIDKIPSSSTIYNILKLNNLNKLNTEMIGNSRKEIKRNKKKYKEIQRIIKDNVGDMGHI